MMLRELNNYIKDNVGLYVNNRQVKILNIFDTFNICKIMYMDNKEKAIIDIMAITTEKQKYKYISIHRLGG